MRAWRIVTVIGIVVTATTGVWSQPSESLEGSPEWRVLNIAHRGGIVPGFPENTLTTYGRAIELGVDLIEIDLRGTRDGAVVIVHDATLDRTTDGSGKVSEHTLAELKALDAGGRERIPTYEEVLGVAAGTGVKLLLDVKEDEALDLTQVVRLTERYGAELDVVAGARNVDAVHELRRLNPNIRVLGFVGTPDDIEAFIEAGADIIRVWPRWIQADAELVQRIHGLGKPVWATANDAPAAELEALVRAGVNGILTDLPEVMAEVLRGGGK